MTSFLETAESLLREPEDLLERLNAEPEHQATLLLQLVLITALGFGAFGFVLGLDRSVWMALLAAPKLVFVGLGSLAICLPALHVYGRLLGSRSTALQTAGEGLTAMAVTGLTLLALCPVLLAFSHLTDGTRGGYFDVVLGACALASFAGLRGLILLYRASGEAGRPTQHLLAWAAILGLVGLQSAWLIRPIVGRPGEEHLALLRPLERTAFVALADTLGSAMVSFLAPASMSNPAHGSGPRNLADFARPTYPGN
jgi:hypothetical protein